MRLSLLVVFLYTVLFSGWSSCTRAWPRFRHVERNIRARRSDESAHLPVALRVTILKRNWSECEISSTWNKIQMIRMKNGTASMSALRSFRVSGERHSSATSPGFWPFANGDIALFTTFKTKIETNLSEIKTRRSNSWQKTNFVLANSSKRDWAE